MDTAIIAAIIAALVSVFGLLVQMYLAKRSRESAQIEPTMEAFTFAQKEAYARMRALEREAERLRIRSWDLEGNLITPISTDEARRHVQLADFDRVFHEFANQSQRFIEQWVEVKPDVPLGVESYVRMLRHECLGYTKSIISACHLFRRRKEGIAEIEPQFAKQLLELLSEHRSRIDTFSGVLKSLRQNMIGPNKLLETDA